MQCHAAIRWCGKPQRPVDRKRRGCASRRRVTHANEERVVRAYVPARLGAAVLVNAARQSACRRGRCLRNVWMAILYVGRWAAACRHRGHVLPPARPPRHAKVRSAESRLFRRPPARQPSPQCRPALRSRHCFNRMSFSFTPLRIMSLSRGEPGVCRPCPCPTVPSLSILSLLPSPNEYWVKNGKE